MNQFDASKQRCKQQASKRVNLDQKPFFWCFRMKTNNEMSCSITGNDAVLAIPSRSQDVVHEPSRLQWLQRNALMKVVG